MTLVLGVLAAIGCSDPLDPPKLLDTGWFSTDFVGDPDTCQHRFVSAAPEAGVKDWYWRDRPTFYTSSAEPQAYDAWIETTEGARLPTQLVWDDTGLVFTLEWDGWFAANTSYTLGSIDCAGRHDATFTTSELGLPLGLGQLGALENRTYVLDFAGADWVEPAQIGDLLTLFFNRPVLLGVTYADAVYIDLLGAQGDVDENGQVTQDLNQPAWDFALADFTGAPFVDGYSPEVTFQYANGTELLDVPVTDFHLEGTFSADGSQFGGGVLAGLGDTRNLGSLLLDPNNLGAMCELAGGLGVECVSCPDGEPYCLALRAEHMEGLWVPNLALVDSGG